MCYSEVLLRLRLEMFLLRKNRARMDEVEKKKEQHDY